MSKVLLSDEQILNLPYKTTLIDGKYDDFTMICKAQLKAVIDYLEEPCPHTLYLHTEIPRHWCYKCWVNLKREAGMPGTNSHETP